MWVGENTFVAKDKSIFIIDLLGNIKFYPAENSGWNMPRLKHKIKRLNHADSIRESFHYLKMENRQFSIDIINCLNASL